MVCIISFQSFCLYTPFISGIISGTLESFHACSMFWITVFLPAQHICPRQILCHSNVQDLNYYFKCHRLRQYFQYLTGVRILLVFVIQQGASIQLKIDKPLRRQQQFSHRISYSHNCSILIQMGSLTLYRHMMYIYVIMSVRRYGAGSRTEPAPYMAGAGCQLGPRTCSNGWDRDRSI